MVLLSKRRKVTRAQIRHRMQATEATQRIRSPCKRPVSHTTVKQRVGPPQQRGPLRISVDDVVSIAGRAQEVTSLENRRQVMEEAQKAIRHEPCVLDSSRPQSVVSSGLQAVTSPMPLSAKGRRKKMEHIPILLPLPSDRTFVPSPDTENKRHVTTPIEEMIQQGERCESVARQCCEIMGGSMCRTCRKLESRLLNREKAEQECPRMHVSQQNIATAQMVKRLFPQMSQGEIQDKIARGEIGRNRFPPRQRCPHIMNEEEADSGEEGEEEEEKEEEEDGEGGSVDDTKEKEKPKRKKTAEKKIPPNPFYFLAKLTLQLKGETSTPLFFTNLRRIQTKILSGEVERKSYMLPQGQPHGARLKSAVSAVSSASSKSTLSKLGAKLSESFMPAFVSPRKVKMVEEPAYRVYFEPPLLNKRMQIPNPSFFAGSSEAYSLPERLPDVIEFADSKIAPGKLGRSLSSMSVASTASEEVFEYEKDDLNRSGSRAGKAGSEKDERESRTEHPGTPRTGRINTEEKIDENVKGEEEAHGEDRRNSRRQSSDDQRRKENGGKSKNERQEFNDDDNKKEVGKEIAQEKDETGGGKAENEVKSISDKNGTDAIFENSVGVCGENQGSTTQEECVTENNVITSGQETSMPGNESHSQNASLLETTDTNFFVTSPNHDENKDTRCPTIVVNQRGESINGSSDECVDEMESDPVSGQNTTKVDDSGENPFEIDQGDTPREENGQNDLSESQETDHDDVSNANTSTEHCEEKQRKVDSVYSDDETGSVYSD